LRVAGSGGELTGKLRGCITFAAAPAATPLVGAPEC